MHRSFSRSILAGLLFGATACESGTDPEVQHPIDLVLDFCSSETPVWVAYRNQGADWVRLTPNTEGTVSFTATNDVALAIVRQNGADYNTEIIFAANTELESVSGLICREEGGTSTVHGTVSGVVGSQIALVGMSYSSVYLAANQTSFSLANVPGRPVDVIASRINVTGSNQTADRVVIRRTQSLTHNATMPVIDFAAATALVPTAFGGTISGINTSDIAFAQAYFVSQLGTEHLLANVEPVSNGNVTLYGIPTTALAAGDYHDVFVVAVDDDLVRGVERFFTAPATQALPLGTPLSTPTVTVAASSPTVRMRVQQPRNGDYARAMRAEFLQQQQFSSTIVTVTVTQGYDGTGGWDATMPDFSAANGWQNAWGFVQGSPVEWTISAYGGRPELLFGAPPTDGETVRFASRSSATNVAVGSALLVTAGSLRPFATTRRSPRLVAPSR
jgi:hypothetical protein